MYVLLSETVYFLFFFFLGLIRFVCTIPRFANNASTQKVPA